MQQTFDRIKEQLRHHLPELRKDFYIEKLGIFGSTAQGQVTAKSDIDILVNFSTSPGFFTFIRLEERLSDILGRKVDLVTKNALKNTVKKEILHQVIYV